MPVDVHILQVGPASDGIGSTPVSSNGMVRNDGYFIKKIAEMWATDRNLPPGEYQLDRLPSGFGGFERNRDHSNHTDRYLYGHPKGVFRSIKELYPHFKYLQDHNTSQGCLCKLCFGGARRSSDLGAPSRASTPGRQPTAAPKTSTARSTTIKPKAVPKGSLLRPSLNTPAPKNRQADELGTPDVYRKLLDRLRAAGPNGVIDESIVDALSPDWKIGHNLLMHVLDEWRAMPKYVPRGGELVLFPRSIPVDTKDDGWLRNPRWEVGVVAETPVEAIEPADLFPKPNAETKKKQSIVYSGFRVEPLSDPIKEDKSITHQHKYVPLFAIRPLILWKQYIKGDVKDWHPTVRHALTVACSFCIIGKYQFKGTWPNATVFARGVYLGAELIMVGDTVRLLPRAGYQPEDGIADIMSVTSIRLRFVNLEAASDDDYDDDRPYTTCLHISGRAFTLDPSRSFDGIGKSHVKSDDPFFHQDMEEYGQWYHILDPSNRSLRLEVPYTRVAGRYYEHVALKAWLPNTEQAHISQGLPGLREARQFSLDHDTRIDKTAGKTWFWADSRTEQLGLHEVNGRFVGTKDPDRTKTHHNVLRKALKLLDGNGSFEEYLEERNRFKNLLKQQEEDVKPSINSWGLASQAKAVSISDSSSDDSSDDDAMEIDAEIGETPEAYLTAGEEVGNEHDNDEMYD